VVWQFDRKGLIILEALKKVEINRFQVQKKDGYEKVDKDELMLSIMEIDGVDDVLVAMEETDEESREVIRIIIAKEKLSLVLNDLKSKGYKIVRAELIWLPRDPLSFDEQRCEKMRALIDEIEELDDIENIWSNVKL
jgi:transcriptional/translational regulatory protein YebC/TACO1